MLRHDAYPVPTDDGVCILTNSGDVVLTGRSIFQWIERLTPYLDGRFTLADLTETMPADRRAMTERIIEALREQQVVIEAEESEHGAAWLTEAERAAFGNEIGFLARGGPSGERRFHAYRETTIAVVGAGRMMLETVAAALCSGSRRIRVVVTDECATDPVMLAEHERLSTRRDAEQQITYRMADLTDEARLSEVIEGAGIVIYASDRAAAHTARALDAVCGRCGIPFLAVVVDSDEALLGPFGPVTGAPNGWTSAWRRLLALRGTTAGRQREPADGEAHSAAEAVPTVVGNIIIREATRMLSGLAEQGGPNRMSLIDLPSLRERRLDVLPHPFSMAASEVDEGTLRATMGRLRDGERMDAEDFARRALPCLQARLGVLGEVSERDFAQLPLAVSQVQVSDPMRLLAPGVPLPIVTGVDLSLTQARRAAVMRALATYASLVVDPRRLHVAWEAADPRTGDPDDDLASLLAGDWHGYVWGYALADGLPREVPAVDVFPALRLVGSTYEPPVGVAAGYDWAEAVRTGLLSRCRQLTVAELADGRRQATPVEWSEVPLDGSGERYRSMVKIIGQRLGVFDVTGSLGVPTLAIRLHGVTLAYTSGMSFGEALRDGLAEVLLAYQANTGSDNGYAPARVPSLPSSRRTGGAPRVAACPAWSTDVEAILVRLNQLGWAAVVVPLDHDPAVTDIMPYLIAMVLARV
jgi:hypothetical protein